LVAIRPLLRRTSTCRKHPSQPGPWAAVGEMEMIMLARPQQHVNSKKVCLPARCISKSPRGFSDCSLSPPLLPLVPTAAKQAGQTWREQAWGRDAGRGGRQRWRRDSEAQSGGEGGHIQHPGCRCAVSFRAVCRSDGIHEQGDGHISWCAWTHTHAKTQTHITHRHTDTQTHRHTDTHTHTHTHRRLLWLEEEKSHQQRRGWAF